MEATELRDALYTRLATLVGREQAISKHLRGEDGRLEADFADRVAFTEMDEVLEGLDEAAREELALIRVQLERLEGDSWKDCMSCGDPIGEGRLRALPTAMRCVKCAS